MNFYVICMNPECKFSAVGSSSDLKFCPDCGGQNVIDACPYCKQSDHLGILGKSVYFIKKNQEFCHECGKRIKTEMSIK